ncbi:MAG: GPP34 family phosphoprotein [Candidatus Krumholzibacteriota bacterium]
MTRKPLPLYEEILLLALDDDKGTTSQGGFFRNSMGGAILAELALNGSLSIANDKGKRVQVVRHGRLDDPILDECLTMVREAKKPKKASEWVMKFAALKDLKNRVARQLVAKGVLAEDTGSVLKIFKRTIYPEVDGGPEKDLRERMEKAIFTATTNMETRTVVIIALAHAGNMLKNVFPKNKLKERKQRLEKLTSGQLAGKATKEAVAAVQAAIMVTAVMPAIYTAAT